MALNRLGSGEIWVGRPVSSELMADADFERSTVPKPGMVSEAGRVNGLERKILPVMPVA